MKMKLITILTVAVLPAVISGTSQAVELEDGPIFMHALNYEIRTNYSGGVTGEFYFRTEDSYYYTQEHGYIDKDNLPAGATYGGLIDDAGSALEFFKPIGLEADEDTFGLLRILTLANGNVGAKDSRFGDGSDLTDIGNNISQASLYWAEGLAENNYLRGMFYGLQDQVVECIIPNQKYRFWSANGKFDIYLIEGDAAYDPAAGGSPTPSVRMVMDEFPGWFDSNTDSLMWSGSIEYYVFLGDVSNPQAIVGETETLLDLSANKDGVWDDRFINWWTAPNGSMQNIWQSWKIGQPFFFNNGWTGSEDAGRGVCQDVCMVDLPDLDNFVSQWLQSGDLDSNFDWQDNPQPENLVDLHDYSTLASYWFEYCPNDWPWP